MRKKLLSVALCATMVAGLLAGCGSSSKSDKASSDSKGSVYWLNRKQMKLYRELQRHTKKKME